jgi:hypothetical protein
VNEHLPSSQDATAEPEGEHRPLIEIGWVAAGRLDAADQEAIEQARQSVLAYLRNYLPGYEWEMPLLRREAIGEGARQEPVVLLENGVEERGVKRWDFVIVVAGADLVSHYKPYAWAAVSRSLEALVISTSRIDPLAGGDDSAGRVRHMARRIATLALHGLGDLFGASHEKDPHNYLAEFQGVEDLDQADRYSQEQLERMRQSLDEVADRRLEEQTRFHGAHRLKFYAHAAWINRGEIAAALVQARPWQFPFRLSRLTTAAVSAALILAVTAEAWELGMSQSGWFAMLLSMMTIAVTTAYLLARQQLLLRRERARLSEQRRGHEPEHVPGRAGGNDGVLRVPGPGSAGGEPGVLQSAARAELGRQRSEPDRGR